MEDLLDSLSVLVAVLILYYTNISAEITDILAEHRPGADQPTKRQAFDRRVKRIMGRDYALFFAFLILLTVLAPRFYTIITTSTFDLFSPNEVRTLFVLIWIALGFCCISAFLKGVKLGRKVSPKKTATE